jgi:micrococcal nuclease
MYQYNVKIHNVVDGDTVDVDIDLGFGIILHNQRVRLEGIDTPESRTSDKVEKIFGLAAKQRVKDFFYGTDIVLVSKEYDPRGKYGRILGDILVYGVSLCDTLLSEGYAVPYNGNSKEVIEELHLKNRDRLIAEGRVSI